MKKIIKRLIWFLIIVFVIYLTPKLLFINGFDYKETFSTDYSRHDTTKTINTSHLKIDTPKSWIHIFHCYGEEGEAVGSFLTKSGLIKYEYGMFSNPFDLDSIFVFSRDSIIANRFIVYLGHNDKNETGIYIPRQNEMEWSFSFFMSKSCTDNLAEILNGINQMEFKKFYNINWEVE